MTRIEPSPQRRHGGDLSDIVTSEDSTHAGWLDLSTGINPQAYPIPEFETSVWQTLPNKKKLNSLCASARDYYGVPDSGTIIGTAGSQMAIQTLPALFPRSRVQIYGPTYSEHETCWRYWGHDVVADADVRADIKVIVNPNNPDGRLLKPDALAEIAEKQKASDGWLIVDEAFMDLYPDSSAVSLAGTSNTIILKSFGKFFGLAGVRLGFVIGPGVLIQALKNQLGPWSLSGPALEIGINALSDRAWQEKTRIGLAERTVQMDKCLSDAGLTVVGGTNLFRLVESDLARELFDHLFTNQIYVRKFQRFPRWIRMGIPGKNSDLELLRTALEASFSK
ncbi:MAG: threonine-phosphate decarboxylase CobD [Methyloligellaceae bacterium]